MWHNDGYVNVDAIQINPTVGDLSGNTKKILGKLRELPGAVDIAAFPELSITGYPPLDLVLRKGFVEEQLLCLERIKNYLRDEAPHLEETYVVLGVVTRTEEGTGLHNSLVVLHQGKEVLRYHKQLLPTYNIFDERRLFTPGSKDQDPVLNIRGLLVAFFVCEDLWSGEEVSLYSGRDLVAENQPKGFLSAMFNRKLDLVVSINASPADVGKVNQRHELFAGLTCAHHVSLLYVNQVGGNDDQVFDGGSFLMDGGGNIRYTCDLFEEDDFDARVDRRGRIGNLMRHADQRVTMSSKYLGGLTVSDEDGTSSQKLGRAYMLETLITGVRDYVNKCGFKGVTISLSGGVDSALVTTLAVLALGRERVECTTMPSKYSSEGSVSDSQQLCDNLGIKLYTLSIGAVVEAQMEAYKDSFGEDMSPLAQENLQAAIRGNAIMRRSNSSGNLVLIGSNKSEGSVGYFTMFGDSNGGLAPIGDLYKTEVYDICYFINENLKALGLYEGPDVSDYDVTPVIPLGILEKEPSAELAPGQVDSNSLPPYEVLDAILKLFIEGDLLSDNDRDELRLTVTESGIAESEIKRVLGLVDKTEYKRRMLAPILRVHARAFGSGRILPLAKGKDTHADMWLFR